MNEYGVVLESGAVRFERLLPGPVERVWSYLTDSDKRGTWLASGQLEPRVGGTVDLLFKHSEITSERPPGRYREMNDKGWPSKGTVTRYEPMTALAMTWPGEGSATSEVTFELTPEGDKVKLVLTHRKLANKAEMTDVSGGWHAHLGILEDKLAGDPPRGFWSKIAGLEAEYAKRFADLPV
ncbi:SRPBCC family protein [Bosea vestrisii]|uniref:SRPBCC family protein n=1 Tax=Bosea vestrisii TaxID=151416 RepID=UPI0024DFA455|nr:SRPBCC family protein [Bosea vestrisii]WID96296.1 SRPBCC family protein [Bosea vestrisii]